jgi:hypothetical protein
MESTHAIPTGARRAAILVIAFAIGAAFGGLTLFVWNPATPLGDRELPGDTRSLRTLFDTSQPLMTDGGSQPTLAGAESAAGYEVPTPDTAVASFLQLKAPEVWFSANSREVGLRYGNSLVIMYSPWPTGKDPGKTYELQATQFHAGYTTILNGNPAWVVPKDSQEPGFPEVDVVHTSVGSVEATFFGQMPLDALVLLASSL